MAKKEVMICDRCGRQYEINDHYQISDGKRDFNPREVSVGVLFREKHNIDCEMSLEERDLCPYCAKELFEWLYRTNKTAIR